MPSIASEMDTILAERGYRMEAETCTLFAEFFYGTAFPAGNTVIKSKIWRGWLEAQSRFAGSDALSSRIYGETLKAIIPETAFAAGNESGDVAAVAYGVLDGKLLVIESVATDPNHRGKGLAARCVGSLMNWAASKGAWGAVLQVMADNTPALRLYRKLGFATELYRYHYRVKSL